MRLLAQWCDAVELWLTSLPYVLQVMLVLVVLAGVAIVIVRTLTAMIDRVANVLHRPTVDREVAAATAGSQRHND